MHKRQLSQPERLEARNLLAGIVWFDGPQLIAPRADATAIVAPSNQVMLIGGGSSTVENLSSSGTSWSLGFSTPKNPTAAGAVRTGSHIFEFGGRSGNQGTEEAFEYDYAFGDSQDIANLPTPRSDLSSAIDSFGRAYAIGGEDGNNVFDVVERYDYTSDSWTEIASLPAPLTGASAANDGNGHILVFGGSSTSNDSSIQSAAYKYDVFADTWSTIASMPVGTSESAIAIDADGLIYVIGGKASSGVVASVQVYNPSLDVWTTETDLPEPVYSAAATVDTSDRLMVIGGYNASGVAIAATSRSQPLNLPDAGPSITSYAIVSGAADRLYTYDVKATGNPPPTFALVTAPSGMTINTATGVITWQPLDSQVGTQAVTVRAKNRAGNSDQSFTIDVAGDTTAPSIPMNFQVTNVTTSTAALSWDASTDAKGVDHYTVYKGHSCGWRGRNTCYAVFRDGITETNVTLTDLTGSYKLRIAAVDAAGNVSARSNLVTFSMLTVPKIYSYDVYGVLGASNAKANFPMAAKIVATGNPTPTLTMVSGPSGMTFDPVTQVASWTPTAGDVGTASAVFQAFNAVTASQLVLPITINADVPILSFRVNPNSGTGAYAVSGQLLEIQPVDSSHTPSVFELVSGPSGATMDPVTGLIQWTPTTNDAGTNSFQVRATNSAGVDLKTIGIRTYFTDKATGLTVTDTLALHPIATWTAPTGAGSDLIAGYTVEVYRRYRWGRSYRSERILMDSPGTGTSLELVGMKENTTYNLYVTPYPVAGDVGIRSTEVVTFKHTPLLPNLSWSVQGINGTTSVVAGQPMTIQFTDNNSASFGTLFEVVSAPAGFAIDANTGLASWTPTAAEVGATNNISIRATNTVGPRNITIPINVYFSGAVENLVAVSHGTYVTATWQPPATNVEPVASYQITQYFKIGGRPRTRTFTVAGTTTSVDAPLVPTGAVYHYGISVTPINADGSHGISTLFQFA